MTVHRDYAVFGFFFAFSIVIASVPASSVVLGLLFPICAMFLAVRRAFLLLSMIAGINLLIAYSSFFGFIGAAFAFLPMFLAGSVSIWLFKNLEKASIFLAYLVYVVAYFSIVGIVTMFELFLGLTIFQSSLLGLSSALSFMIPPLSSSDVSGISFAAEQFSAIFSAASPYLFLVMVATAMWWCFSFYAEYWLLKTIQRRIRGIPLYS